jgi:Fur family transcriptional regulator, ferric uptake regulator
MAWRDQANERLRATGRRSGAARAAVVDLLADESCCLSAQELHVRLGSGGAKVGVASVYRALDQLAGLGLVQRVDVGDGIARYERVQADDHHHHVVCDDCGRVEPFADESLERAISQATGRLGYDVSGHEIVLRGACADCRPGGLTG